MWSMFPSKSAVAQCPSIAKIVLRYKEPVWIAHKDKSWMEVSTRKLDWVV
jgi:hypothetical protein